MNKRITEVLDETRPHWVGDGFPVRSLFGTHNFTGDISPFLMLDYAGPYEFPPGEAGAAARGVGEHPHRGFETVTIVYQGELEHRDSAGNRGQVGPGDVQWMTAASGVVHEEYHSPEFQRRGGPFELVQMWVNLPAKLKMSPPRYQEILAGQIPTVALPGGVGEARVIAGECNGVRGPAKTFTPVNVWDVTLRAGARVALAVEDGHFAAVVVRRGAVAESAGGAASAVGIVDAAAGATPQASLVLLSIAGDQIEIDASPTSQESRLLVLSGTPLGEPVVAQGPFVMNTPDEIQQAIVDYHAGRMGSFA